MQYFNSSVVRLEVGGLFIHCLQWFNFNSSVVRLEASLPVPGKENIYHFNSSVVRLEDLHVAEGWHKVTLFQFQCGTIRRVTPSGAALLDPHFNSSVVRLEGFGFVFKRRVNVFQFQCGTIRSTFK